jgi:hypothetical protein
LDKIKYRGCKKKKKKKKKKKAAAAAFKRYEFYENPQSENCTLFSM